MMKPIHVVIALALLAAMSFGCGDQEKKNKDGEKGAIESVIEYGTGQTALNVKSKAKRVATDAALKQGISMFEFDTGRKPNSLQELVDGSYIAREHTKDEYGRPLESSLSDGAFVVRSMKADGTLNWELKF